MLSKLYQDTKESFFSELFDTYQKRGYAVVNFLYFANAVQYHLLDNPNIQTDSDKQYAKALFDGDFLLPDGIALQVWNRYFNSSKKRISNLNGTDLTPAILDFFSKQYESKNIQVFVYSLYDERIGKSKDWLHIGVDKLSKHFGIEKIYAYQSHYNDRGKDFPWETMSKHCDNENGISVRIFLNCTGSPFQENRVYANKQWFIDNKMLVLNVGGFMDFFSGFEKRAPKRVVKARVLETFWRIITNPKKNLKKFIAMFGVVGLLRRKITSGPSSHV